MIAKAFIDKLDQHILAENDLDLLEKFVEKLAYENVKNPQKRADKLIFNWNIYA